MAITKLELKNFTVFSKAEFSFAPGVNVLIGENSTGKTHLLKALYTLARQLQRGSRLTEAAAGVSLAVGLIDVFGTRDARPLVRTRRPRADVKLFHGRAFSTSVQIGADGGVSAAVGSLEGLPRPVFVPAHELLSNMFGFAEAVRNRELDFDLTYLDLADALNASPLKGPSLTSVSALLAQAEGAVGGRAVRTKDGRFQIKQGDASFEAGLVAEGLRKLAQIARLLRNGRIAPGTLLLWDEPEANLNPVLLRKVVDLILALARNKVQVVLATHDYLLSQTLSLHAEHPKKGTPKMQFIGLARGKAGAVEVQQADTLAGIKNNPILREHAAQYDLELAAFEGED